MIKIARGHGQNSNSSKLGGATAGAEVKHDACSLLLIAHRLYALQFVQTTDPREEDLDHPSWNRLSSLSHKPVRFDHPMGARMLAACYTWVNALRLLGKDDTIAGDDGMRHAQGDRTELERVDQRRIKHLVT